MKIAVIPIALILGIFLVYQIVSNMSTNKTETQAYKVIRVEQTFEIRYYPSATMAMITSQSKSYRDLGSSGFSKLAKYIFGGNSDKKQIAMTSPVHMYIGDTVSTMAFVMPSKFKLEDLPRPNNTEIVIQTSAPEYVAALQFGGFASTEKINEQKALLVLALKEIGLSYHGNFRFLGYNPPYQIFGRRNEVIVALSGEELEKWKFD